FTTGRIPARPLVDLAEGNCIDVTVQNERLPPSSPLQHTNQIRAFGCLLEELRLAPEVLQHWLEVFVALLLAAQYLVHLNARVQRVDTLPLHQFRAEVYDLVLRRIDQSENPRSEERRVGKEASSRC